MSKKIAGFVAMLAVGATAMIVYRIIEPKLRDQLQTDSSDAAGTKTKLTVAMDSWVGYVPLCSKLMRQEMRSKGYLWVCEDDKADYKDRFSKLAKGSIQFAVSTIDGLLTNGPSFDDPGVIVAVLDESKGGDAIIAHKSKFKNLDQVKISKEKPRIALTPSSPSEFLLTAIGVHFDIPRFLKNGDAKRINVEGADQALKKLESKEADIAVLWEPFVTKSLESQEHVAIFSTKDSSQIIVDVLTAQRKFAQENPQIISDVLSAYFSTLRQFRNDAQLLHEEVVTRTKLPNSQVESVLKGVRWYTLTQNARDLFGIVAQENGKKTEGLAESIEATAKVLLDSGFLDKNPIPGQDPFRLQNKSYIENLFQSGVGVSLASLGDEQGGGNVSLTRKFSDLDDKGWQALMEVGTLKVRPISFQSGTGELSDDGKMELDKAANNLAHYPNFRVVVKGHTGISGDAAANRDLSENRARAVVDYLVNQHGISRARLLPLGLGGEFPLARSADESDRAYQYRLPRVELFLVSEVY